MPDNYLPSLAISFCRCWTDSSLTKCNQFPIRYIKPDDRYNRYFLSFIGSAPKSERLCVSLQYLLFIATKSIMLFISKVFYFPSLVLFRWLLSKPTAFAVFPKRRLSLCLGLVQIRGKYKTGKIDIQSSVRNVFQLNSFKSQEALWWIYFPN